jgi:uncharacterized protein YjbJ (UPF0337 family)
VALRCIGFAAAGLATSAIVFAITTESVMNWDQVAGNWKQLQGKVRQQWGKLTDDDLSLIQGKQTELAGRLQERYGYSKEQAEKEIKNWVDSSAS